MSTTGCWVQPKTRKKTKMKKLIITAMCAIGMIATTFGACNYKPVEVKDTAWVYNWKFTGKTTEGVEKTTKVKASACSAAPVTCSVRVPTSLKIQGYTMVCSPGCGDTFGEFEETSEVFWSTKPGKFSLAGGIQVEVMNIIGKKAKGVEVGGIAEFDGDDMSYDLVFAGLGKYDKKKSRMTSASGTFAGFGVPCDCAASSVWDCTSLTLLCDENPNTVAFGRWNVRLDKKASKKYADKGTLPHIPRWAAWKNREADGND